MELVKAKYIIQEGMIIPPYSDRLTNLCHNDRINELLLM